MTTINLELSVVEFLRSGATWTKNEFLRSRATLSVVEFLRLDVYAEGTIGCWKDVPMEWYSDGVVKRSYDRVM